MKDEKFFVRRIKPCPGPVVWGALGLMLWCFLSHSWGGELSPFGNPMVRIGVGDQVVAAEVVATPDKLYLGLSHREQLPEGHGMLFVLPAREIQHFCMRDMRFAIDIIWLAPDKVVGVAAELSPDDPGIFSSPEPVSLVLEVPGGWCRRHGITVNTPVSLPAIPLFP